MNSTDTITMSPLHELVAAPSFLLGFHPDQSCVVIGARQLGGGRKELLFCARLDLNWHATCFDQVAEQLHNAALQAGRCEWILVGFGRQEDEVAPALEELAGVIGEENLLVSLVCDGSRFWPVGSLEDAEPYRFENSALAARAVFEGVNIMSSRESIVAEVEAGVVSPRIWRRAVEQVARMPADLRLSELARLMTEAPAEEAPVDEKSACLLAALLQDDECFVALLADLNTRCAPERFALLARARRGCPEEAAPNVLAVLALCCWLAGRSAQHTHCLEQLAACRPDHPVLGLLLRLHRCAIPPRRWDEE
ncbi:MAG TPA: DUF4192 domain-containing protein [Arachnia sp.]|nr:DUF4192 domain-containing protein [Arachnia sp.]HMT85502.1 DUF4192 domain-containing protein [Arachnia sp.]